MNSYTPNCPICLTRATFLIDKDSFSHYKCGNTICSLIFVYPPPRNLAYVYKHDSTNVCEANKTETSRIIIKETLNINLARKLICKNNYKSVLDIGARSGNFMRGIADLCEKIVGVEPNSASALYCRQTGLNVINEFFPSNKLSSSKFDVINIADVIEHVENPRKLIRDALKRLDSQGTLIIRTPNLNSFWSKQTFLISKFFNLPWSSLTPPEHISNFSLSGLLSLLSEENLTIEEIKNESPSLMYELGQLHLRRNLINKPTLRNILRLLFGYSAYVIVYSINRILAPFLNQNFSQTVIASKTV